MHFWPKDGRTALHWRLPVLFRRARMTVRHRSVSGLFASGRPVMQKLAPLATLLLVLVLDPLGLGAVTDARSRNALYQMTAPFYPETGRDQITVILIDDESVAPHQGNASDGASEVARMQWPPTFDQYNDLLESIELYEPEAVFFDFLFIDERGAKKSLENFSNTIRRMNADGIPVFVAGSEVVRPPGNGSECSVPPGTDILQAIKKAAAALPYIETEGFGDNYPLFVECDGRVLRAPAMELFMQTCRRAETSKRPAACSAWNKSPESLREHSEPPGPFADVLSVRWGENPSRINANLNPTFYEDARTGPRCFTTSGGFTAQAYRFVRRAVAAFFETLAPISDLPCVYHPSVSVKDIFAYQEQGRSLDKEASNEARSILKDLLKGKLVILGSDLSGTHDLGSSPVHGQVPGAMVHAMALDNLLSLGSSHLRPAPPVFAGFPGITLAALLEIGLLTVLVGLDLLATPWKAPRRVAGRNPSPDSSPSHVSSTTTGRLLALLPASGFHSAILFLPFGLTVFVAWLSIGVLHYEPPIHYEPLNWLALLTYALAFTALLHRHYREHQKARNNV